MGDIIQELLRKIDEKDARIVEPTNLMLKYTGVIQPDVKVVVPEATSAHPLGKRWNRIRPLLEERSRGERFSCLVEEASKEIESDASNIV